MQMPLWCCFYAVFEGALWVGLTLNEMRQKSNAGQAGLTDGDGWSITSQHPTIK